MEITRKEKTGWRVKITPLMWRTRVSSDCVTFPPHEPPLGAGAVTRRLVLGEAGNGIRLPERRQRRAAPTGGRVCPPQGERSAKGSAKVHSESAVLRSHVLADRYNMFLCVCVRASLCVPAYVRRSVGQPSCASCCPLPRGVYRLGPALFSKTYEKNSKFRPRKGCKNEEKHRECCLRSQRPMGIVHMLIL